MTVPGCPFTRRRTHRSPGAQRHSRRRRRHGHSSVERHNVRPRRVDGQKQMRVRCWRWRVNTAALRVSMNHRLPDIGRALRPRQRLRTSRNPNTGARDRQAEVRSPYCLSRERPEENNASPDPGTERQPYRPRHGDPGCYEIRSCTAAPRTRRAGVDESRSYAAGRNAIAARPASLGVENRRSIHATQACRQYQSMLSQPKEQTCSPGPRRAPGVGG